MLYFALCDQILNSNLDDLKFQLLQLEPLLLGNCSKFFFFLKKHAVFHNCFLRNPCDFLTMAGSYVVPVAWNNCFFFSPSFNSVMGNLNTGEYKAY